MKAKISWLGLAAGITTLVVVIISLFVPWWHLSVDKITVGDSVNPIASFESTNETQLADAGFSAVSTNFNLLGESFTVPLIWAFSIVGLLLMLTSGVVMVVYSVLPAKPYSKHLLRFAYLKPLLVVLIFFVLPMIVFPLILRAVFALGIPWSGTATLELPTYLFGGDMRVSAAVSAGFLWPFALAVVAAGLCIAAKLYHSKFAAIPQVKPPESAPIAPATTPEGPSASSSAA